MHDAIPMMFTDQVESSTDVGSPRLVCPPPLTDLVQRSTSSLTSYWFPITVILSLQVNPYTKATLIAILSIGYLHISSLYEKWSLEAKQFSKCLHSFNCSRSPSNEFFRQSRQLLVNSLQYIQLLYELSQRLWINFISSIATTHMLSRLRKIPLSPSTITWD
jgi:hypothetical protein